jgi:hypothetical protein
VEEMLIVLLNSKALKKSYTQYRCALLIGDDYIDNILKIAGEFQ